MADTQSLPKALQPELNLVPMQSVYAEALKPPKQSDTPSFSGAFIKSLRSASSNSTNTPITNITTHAPPRMSHQMLLNLKVKPGLVKPSVKPTPGPYTFATPPAHFKTPKSVAGTPSSLAPMRKAPIVFNDNLDDTVTPRGRTAKKGLYARPALRDLTNTPVRPMRPTPLKKETVTEALSVVKVSKVQANQCIAFDDLPCCPDTSYCSCKWWWI